MSYARSRQRTRQFDERLIRRIHADFSYGMARQADIESTDLPGNAAADGINVRFHKVGFEGRPGCKLYQPADFGVVISDNNETLSNAMQSGELYKANGNSIPKAGSVFVVYGTGDFIDNDLEAAKGSPPRRYDCFYIEESTSGSESIRWIGRIGVPAIPGYGDTPATEFTASQSGDIITASAGTFDPALVNCYYNWGDGTRCLIKEYLTSTTVRVVPSQTKASTPNGFIQAQINASLFHEATNKTIALFGDRLFVTKQMPFAGWDEIFPIGGIDTIRPANSAQSLLIPEGDDALLINQKAWYRIKLDAHPYYYKINSMPPNVVLKDEAEYNATTYQYKYNYTYALSRIVGGAIFKDRTNAAEGVMLEHESPPVKTATGLRDWGYIWATRPVGPGTDYYGLLTGAVLDAADQSPSAWGGINDAEFVINYNGTNYNVGVDFCGITDMNDVCHRLQYACKTYQGMKNILWKYETNHFVVSTGKGETIGHVSVLSGGSGTDISEKLKLKAGVGTVNNAASYNAPTTIYYLSMPRDEGGNIFSEWYHATHYALYRTSNIAGLDDGTEGHDYRWVGDIPVAKAFTGATGTPNENGEALLTVTHGTIEPEDRNAVIFAQDGSTCIIMKYLTSTTATVCEFRNADGSTKTTSIPLQSLAIGGGTVFTASQSGTTITIESGKVLTDTDTGKQIFWADGYISVIKRVINGTTAEALTPAERESQGATCDPVSRVCSDIIPDEDIRDDYARYSGWPLRIRYFDAIPAGGIGAITPGFLFAAEQGTNKYVYCSRVYKWHVGYYHPAYQLYTRIIDGIQRFKTINSKIIIYGSHSRYLLDTTFMQNVGENRIGESLPKLSDPLVLSNAVGAVPSAGAAELENGAEILVTNEPAVRVISPEQESENLAEKRIQKSDLQKLKPVYVGAYNPVCGYFLWGKQEV